MKNHAPRAIGHRTQRRPKGLLAAATLTSLSFATPPAAALDGCLVLLCLAAPSWRAIPQCVPPIKQLFRDLAKGKVFPSCGMSGAGSTGAHQWAEAPQFCPPQYTRAVEGESTPTYLCDFTGAVSVTVNGVHFSRTWWSLTGDTVTDFSPAAKQMLGRWDTRFDDDFAAWQALQPPAPITPNEPQP